MPRYVPPGLGWLRDLPDSRDYGPDHEQIRPLLARLRASASRRPTRPSTVTWDQYFSPVENQLGLAACSAHACSGLVQYFERRAHGRALDLSTLFLYQMARRLSHHSGNTGATLRASFKALKRFGLPPRQHWPYLVERCDQEPSGFLFSYAREYESLRYVRLDPPGAEGKDTVARVKAYLAAGVPVAFGFTVFDCLRSDPEVPFPSCFDTPLGGQATIAVGYDDAMRIHSEKGALRIRNSWGPDWGEDGSGWLPYRYITDHLAADFWTLLRADWLKAGEFLPLL